MWWHVCVTGHITQDGWQGERSVCAKHHSLLFHAEINTEQKYASVFNNSNNVHEIQRWTRANSLPITAGRSNQDPRCTQKPMYVPNVSHNRRSSLLCTPVILRRVFAIYQSLLGWKTWKYFYETNTNFPTQGQPHPRKK